MVNTFSIKVCIFLENDSRAGIVVVLRVTLVMEVNREGY